MTAPALRTELHALALSVAQDGARMAREMREAGVAIADRKTSVADIVTEADRAVETAIRDAIAEADKAVVARTAAGASMNAPVSAPAKNGHPPSREFGW